jgi:putative transposase
MQTPYLLADSLWEKIRTSIEPKPRKRKVSLQLIFSGIIFLLDSGCKWRQLPQQYGDFNLVWYYLNKWTRYGVLEGALQQLGRTLRKKQGRKAEPTRLIIDSQSVKTPAGTGDETGYDANKKIKGRKRHIAVDSEGTIVSAGVTSALVADKVGVRVLQDDVEDMASVRQIVADYAYRGKTPFSASGRIRWLIVRRGGETKFVPLPIRWIVERTFAWLNNYRRLVRDYEKTLVMSRAMILAAAIHITLKKLDT